MSADREAALAIAARSRQAQGLPPTVDEPAVLAQVARIVVAVLDPEAAR